MVFISFTEKSSIMMFYKYIYVYELNGWPTVDGMMRIFGGFFDHAVRKFVRLFFQYIGFM